MNCFLLLIVSAVAYAQMPNAEHDNYYEPTRDSRVGQRLIMQLKTAGVTTTPADSRLEELGGRLAAHSPEFKYQFFVYEGGTPSMDLAPAGAFPADWRRLQLNEAIAIAGGTIYVSRELLSRDDAQLSAILAHAIGHIAMRHSTRSMTRGELDQVEAQAASRAMPDEAERRLKAIPVNRYAFDRQCELEADAYAVKLLHESGLNPSILIAYLRTLPVPKDKEMSVYPPPAERVDAAQKAIAGLGR